MLRRAPSLTRYAMSKERNFTFTKAWASPYFGSSVLNPVGAVLKKRTRKNPLEE